MSQPDNDQGKKARKSLAELLKGGISKTKCFL